MNDFCVEVRIHVQGLAVVRPGVVVAGCPCTEHTRYNIQHAVWLYFTTSLVR